MPKFNIATDQGVLQVEGELITIGKWKCFLCDSPDGEMENVVCEFYSGMSLTESLYKTEKDILTLIESTDEFTIKKKILSELQRNGIKYPVNL